jgi:hypothetical protein
MRLATVLVVAAVVAADAPSLAVERGGAWRSWWRADRAPTRWTEALPAVSDALTWEEAQPGVEWGAIRLSGSGEAWRLRAIVLRLDPAQLELRLVAPADQPRGARRRPPNRWSLDDAPSDAIVALNAGQFGANGPWGWVVREGAERQAPGRGPLAPAVVVDRSGRVRIVPADSIEAVRTSGVAVEAFQSYPALLSGDGEVPAALRTEGSGVDLRHRDSRLAIGELRDGRLLVVLTRFEGLGGVLDNLPFGLTTPEMAALMGALGARKAVLLDGGISSQMLLRTASGREERWDGMRYVPLALSIERRAIP